MRSLKVSLWKWRARSAHRRIDRLFDRYDCGAMMIDHLSGGELSRLHNRLKHCILKAKESAA